MIERGILAHFGSDIARFRGKVLLIVNVASQCGFTPQYKGLQVLYERYKERGFEILGVPCNDFGQQEPDDLDEILKFCQTRFSVTFPLFEKVKILGDEIHPLYEALLAKGLLVENSGGFKSFLFKMAKPLIYKLKGIRSPLRNGVEWNFHKFVINRKAEPTAHFSSDVEPDNSRLIRRIELELNFFE